FLLALAGLQERRPAARPGIAAAGAVGIDLDHAWERVVGLTSPPITAGFSRIRGRIGVRVYMRLRALSRYAPAGSGEVSPRRSFLPPPPPLARPRLQGLKYR